MKHGLNAHNTNVEGIMNLKNLIDNLAICIIKYHNDQCSPSRHNQPRNIISDARSIIDDERDGQRRIDTLVRRITGNGSHDFNYTKRKPHLECMAKAYENFCIFYNRLQDKKNPPSLEEFARFKTALIQFYQTFYKLMTDSTQNQAMKFGEDLTFDMKPLITSSMWALSSLTNFGAHAQSFLMEPIKSYLKVGDINDVQLEEAILKLLEKPELIHGFHLKLKEQKEKTLEERREKEEGNIKIRALEKQHQEECDKSARLGRTLEEKEHTIAELKLASESKDRTLLEKEEEITRLREQVQSLQGVVDKGRNNVTAKHLILSWQNARFASQSTPPGEGSQRLSPGDNPDNTPRPLEHL